MKIICRTFGVITSLKKLAVLLKVFKKHTFPALFCGDNFWDLIIRVN